MSPTHDWGSLGDTWWGREESGPTHVDRPVWALPRYDWPVDQTVVASPPNPNNPRWPSLLRSISFISWVAAAVARVLAYARAPAQPRRVPARRAPHPTYVRSTCVVAGRLHPRRGCGARTASACGCGGGVRNEQAREGATRATTAFSACSVPRCRAACCTRRQDNVTVTATYTSISATKPGHVLFNFTHQITRTYYFLHISRNTLYLSKKKRFVKIVYFFCHID